MKNKIKIAQSIVANQVAMNYLHEVRFTPYYKQRLKNLLNQVNEELEKAERQEYDVLDNEIEENNYVYYSVSEAVKEIAGVDVFRMPDIINILRAYKKDPKSVIGITNKILK
jgi:hypothetical protein